MHWVGGERKEGEMATMVFPSSVRAQVLEQHRELRVLLEAALEELGREGSVEEAAEVRLRAVGRELCERFCAHFAFEGETLRPVLAALDSWGPERVRALDDEHARQRRQLEDIRGRCERGACDAGELHAVLCELAADLARDMAEEEEGCLTAALLGAELLMIDRG
jgi:hypothetical protein